MFHPKVTCSACNGAGCQDCDETGRVTAPCRECGVLGDRARIFSSPLLSRHGPRRGSRGFANADYGNDMKIPLGIARRKGSPG